MAGLAAFIVPIGALVSGEGLAALALERHNGNDFREEHWREVEFMSTYRAVFVRYLQGGLPDKEAKLRALSEVKEYLAKSSPSAVRMLSAPNGQSAQEANEQAQLSPLKARVHTYLVANPELADGTVNEVLASLRAAGTHVGRTTVASSSIVNIVAPA